VPLLILSDSRSSLEPEEGYQPCQLKARQSHRAIHPLPFGALSPMPSEVIVSTVAITLDRTVKIDRNEFLQTLRLPSRVPLKEHVFTWPVCHPKITLPGLSVSRIEIFDRCLIDLDVGRAHHLVFDLAVDRL